VIGPVTARTLQGDGTILAQAPVAGSASGLGPYQGTVAMVYDPRLRTFAGVTAWRAVLRFDAADELDLNFFIVFGAGNRNARFNGSFYVTGGTGRFADATGSGGMNGTAGMRSLTLNYQLEGPVTF
jgi:hypothetical protein